MVYNASAEKPTIDYHELETKNNKIIKHDIFLLIIFFFGLCAMVLNQSFEVPSKVIIAFSIILLVKSDFFPGLLLPFVIMNNAIGTIPGTSIMLYWIYIGMVFVRYTLLKRIYIKSIFLIPLIIYILYELIKVLPQELHKTISDIGFLLTIILVNSEVVRNKKLITKHLLFLPVLAIISGILPLINGSSSAFQALGYTRLGSLGMDDPNYSSVIYNLGIFAILCARFRKFGFLRYIMITTLYFLLIQTLSITGIIANLIGLSIYILTQKNFVKSIRALVLISIIAIIVALLIQVLPNNPAFEGIELRVQGKFSQLSSGDLASATTDRSTISETYMNYFVSQNFWHLLTGLPNPLFYYVNYLGAAAHNTFIDFLYSSGLIGTVIFILYLFKRSISYYRKYLNDGSIVYFGIYLIKLILVIYMFGLSMYSTTFWQFILFL